jgi:microcompartment protein CcmK/EutM
MRIARVIGTVTLNQQHAAMTGARYKIVVPLSLDNLTNRTPETTEELIAYDDLGAGIGSLVALSEGGEAAQPFRPAIKPVDAYCAAILDRIDIAADV